MTCAALALLLTAPPPGVAPELWRHLRGWEAAMAGVTSLVSERGTKSQTVGGRTTTYDANVWFHKPDRLRLRLDLQPIAGQKPDPNAFETYICNERSVTEYDGPTRTATEYPARLADLVGQNPLVAVLIGRAGEHPLLSILSGRMTARRLAMRYTVGWAKPGDATYLYLELVPLQPEDQRELQKMTLVLVKPGLPGAAAGQAYLPRMAQLVKPKAQVIETWDFPNVQANSVKTDGTPIGVADFEPIDPGPGWKVIKAARPDAR